MAELADALDLGSSIFGCAGSTPAAWTLLPHSGEINQRGKSY